MLLEYVSSVKATIAFWRLLKIGIGSPIVNEALHNHPDQFQTSKWLTRPTLMYFKFSGYSILE